MKKSRIDLVTDEGKILLALLQAEEALSYSEISWKTELVDMTVRRKLPRLLEAGLIEESKKEKAKHYKLSEEFRKQTLKELPEEYHKLSKQIKEHQKQLEILLIQVLIKVSFGRKKTQG